MAEPVLLEPTPNWTDSERPALPGSPSMPYHRPAVRVAYALVGILTSLTGGLANAMISVNLPQLQGMLGLTPVEGTWLTAAYFMVNVSSNLLLFKCRQQFGVRRFAEVAIIANLLMMIAYLFADNFEMAVATRAMAGFAAAPMTTLGMYYVLQAFPRAYVGKALCIGLGLSQLATPIAYIISPSLLNDGGWHNLYRFEFGMALCSLACIFVLKLPPSIRIKVIEPMDFLTFLLIAPALALVGAVLAQGRTQWWTSQAWMGYALVAALALLVVGLTIEHHRERPLIQTRWLGSIEALRFVLGALTMRLLLSEQTYAATGMLRLLGMGPDQLAVLNLVILAGAIAGIALSASTFGPKAIMPQILASAALIVIGSLIDHQSSSLTRPQNMMVSQFLIAAAAGMFMGPMLIVGFMRVLGRGMDHVVTFTVLFGITQAMGGLAGSAILGTFQQFREHEYSASINAKINPTDPIITQRITTYTQLYAPVITDPVRRKAQATALIAQKSTIEANVLAYDDVFLLNALIALTFLIWSLADIGFMRIKARLALARAGPATA